ncbi:site-2 protease family protein, partial [Myxococcota bacterium]|nr:site-2 protease family protein [Myxococcota bacterium]
QELLASIRGSGGAALPLVVERDGATRTITVVPRGIAGDYRIGVEYEATAFRERPMGVAAGASEALAHVWRSTVGLVTLIPSLFQKGGLDKVSGPVGMVKSLGKSLESSLARSLGFVAEISVALAVWNLLPFPALDGSRLLFLVVGLIRRKPIERRLEAWIHAVGFIILIAFLLVVSFADFRR